MKQITISKEVPILNDGKLIDFFDILLDKGFHEKIVKYINKNTL